MTREIPGPLRAAAGLAAVAVDEARRLPTRLAGLPVLAVGAAMQASMRAQQRYAELIGRGDQVLSHLREPDEQPPWARFDEDDTGAPAGGGGDGGDWAFSDDQLEERLSELDAEPGDEGPDEDLYAPSAEPAIRAAEEPAAADPAGPDLASADAGLNGQHAPTGTGSRPRKQTAANGTAAGLAGGSRSQAPKATRSTGGSKTSKATASKDGTTKASTSKAGASKDNTSNVSAGKETASRDGVESKDGRDSKGGRDSKDSRDSRDARDGKARKAAQRAKSAQPAKNAQPAESGQLPLPNYDSLTLPQLRARIAKLSSGQLTALLAHEREHAARPPYLTMLENRLGRLAGS